MPKSKRNWKDLLIQKFLKDNAYSWLAFFCSAGIMLLVYFVYQLIPFGDITILRMDLYHQYGPLYGELYDRLVNFQSLLYSWTTGMGGGFLGNYLNYLSGPLSFLVVLFGRSRVLEAIAALILLKCAISSFTFTYYVRKALNLNNFAASAFGVLYSFCGFFIAYYWNIMWLDGMALFPLVVLGIELLINKKKFGLYVFALAMTLFSSYYMGFMACLFSVIYFLIYYFSHYGFTSYTKELESFPDKKGRPSFRYLDMLRYSRLLTSGVRFALASLAAGGLVAFALLPVYYILQESSATSGSFPEQLSTYFKIFDFLANHLSAVEPTIRSSGEDVLPNVYCGVATLLLVPLYLFTKSISLREKTAHIVLLAALFFSFNTNYMNYIWHGFHFPNDLPYRFSFMYSFVLLILAVKAFQRLHEFSGKELLGVGSALVFGIILIEKIGSKNVDYMTVYISIIFAAVYTLAFYLMQKRRSQAAIVSVLMLCCVIAEAAAANTDHYSMDQPKTNFAGDFADFRRLKAQLDERETGIYRMELSRLRARMDPAWYGYNGVSTFSSMAYERLSNLQRRLGMFGNYINSYTYHRQTAVYNALTSLKYVVDNEQGAQPEMNPALYEYVAEEGIFKAYENRWFLPIAYCVRPEIMDWYWEHNFNPFEVQGEYFELTTGVADVFEKIDIINTFYDNVQDIPYGYDSGSFSFTKVNEGESGSFTFVLQPLAGQNVYLFARSNQITTLTAKGDTLSTYQNVDGEYILDLGYCAAGEEISVDFSIKNEEGSGNLTFYAYGLNQEAFQQGYDVLKAGQLNVARFDERLISGTVFAEEDCVLYTSIPFDGGWHVTVDGVPVEKNNYLAIGESLLGVRLPAGEHEVVLRFTPQGLYLGLAVTLFSALALLAYAWLSAFLRKRRAALSPVTEALPAAEMAAFPVDMLPEEEQHPESPVSIAESPVEPLADFLPDLEEMPPFSEPNSDI